MASAIVNPHDKMRGRDVNKVARGEQAPRPAHEPGSVADSPPDGGAAIEIRTAPCDFRFPTQNQTRHCYARYLEYHRCMKAKQGGDRSECEKFQRYYRSLCPTDWVVEWNRQRKGYFQDPSDDASGGVVASILSAPTVWLSLLLYPGSTFVSVLKLTGRSKLVFA